MKKIICLLIIMAAIASCTSKTETKVAGNSDTEAVERVIMSRRSVRQYTDKLINRDTLNRILECGINAPNGKNRQAYEIRVIDKPEMLAEITAAVAKDNPDNAPKNGAKNIFANATCVVFIANDTTYDVSQIDCGLLGGNIVLSAWSRGIGSCCMAHPVRLMKESKSCAPYLAKLGFSKDFNLLYCIAMGYPAENPPAKPRKADRIRFVD
mgnify:CR=1 FL=1